MPCSSSLFRAVVLAAFSTPVLASEYCTTTAVPPIPAGASYPASVPGFDAALGTLTAVRVEIMPGTHYLLYLENLFQTFEQTITSNVDVSLELDPAGDLSISTSVTDAFVDTLGAYDGATDFAGNSGETHLLSPPVAVSQVSRDPVVLAAFTGGTVALPFTTVNHSQISGFALVQLRVSAVLRVCYEYEPPSTTSFCEGSGAPGVCPCANESDVGMQQGCRNSSGAGAHLAASGVASVGSDTLALTVSGLPASSVAMLIQGTGAGSGVVFGDGLFCLSGPFVRLGAHAASAGSASFPSGGDSALSSAGAAVAGDLVEYQVRYRDASAFCTPETFNWSQGLRVLWAP